MGITSERLRNLRDSKNMTQKEVAALIGTTQQIYSNYEADKNDLPIRHLVALAEFYDVSADYLLGRVNYRKMPPEFSTPLIQQVTVGDFVCRISSFSTTQKRQLVDYVNYLIYIEKHRT